MRNKSHQPRTKISRNFKSFRVCLGSSFTVNELNNELKVYNNFEKEVSCISEKRYDFQLSPGKREKLQACFYHLFSQICKV